ncbi:MAG: YbjN domain-containing protein [Planctomycetia bacterium]|nr:YbjN domain-containing protein [Planctomycetia bacterium]
MKTKFGLGTTIFAMIFGLATTAMAQDVIEKMSAKQIEGILDSLADKDLISSYEELDAVNTYKLKIEGVNVLLFNNGDDMRLYVGFNTESGISLAKINEWNRDNYFSHAYIDDDKDPCLESDLLLTGGVTEKVVQRWILRFGIAVLLFQDSFSK